jgi:hypothetical protein
MGMSGQVGASGRASHRTVRLIKRRRSRAINSREFESFPSAGPEPDTPEDSDFVALSFKPASGLLTHFPSGKLKEKLMTNSAPLMLLIP